MISRQRFMLGAVDPEEFREFREQLDYGRRRTIPPSRHREILHPHRPSALTPKSREEWGETYMLLYSPHENGVAGFLLEYMPVEDNYETAQYWDLVFFEKLLDLLLEAFHSYLWDEEDVDLSGLDVRNVIEAIRQIIAGKRLTNQQLLRLINISIYADQGPTMSPAIRIHWEEEPPPVWPVLDLLTRTISYSALAVLYYAHIHHGVPVQADYIPFLYSSWHHFENLFNVCCSHWFGRGWQPTDDFAEQYVVRVLLIMSVGSFLAACDSEFGGDADHNYMNLWMRKCIAAMSFKDPEDIETVGSFPREEYEELRRQIDSGTRRTIDPWTEREIKLPHQAPREINLEKLLFNNNEILPPRLIVANIESLLNREDSYNIATIGLAGMAWIETLYPDLQYVDNAMGEPVLDEEVEQDINQLDRGFRLMFEDPWFPLSVNYGDWFADTLDETNPELYLENFLYRSFRRMLVGLINILIDKRIDSNILISPLNEIYHHDINSYRRYVTGWANLFFSKLSFVMPEFMPSVVMRPDIDEETFFKSINVLLALADHFQQYLPGDIVELYESNRIPKDIENLASSIVNAVHEACDEMANESTAILWSVPSFEEDQFIVASFGYAVAVDGELIVDANGEFTPGHDQEHMEPPPDYRLTDQGGIVYSTETELFTDHVAALATQKLREEYGVGQNREVPESIVEIVRAFTEVFGDYIIWGSDDGAAEIYVKRR